MLQNLVRDVWIPQMFAVSCRRFQCVPSNACRLGSSELQPHVSRAICLCRKSLLLLRWHGSPGAAPPAPSVGRGKKRTRRQGQELGESRPRDLDGVQPHDGGDGGPLGGTTYQWTISGDWTAGQGLPADRSGSRDTAGAACRMQQLAWMHGEPGARVREEWSRDPDQIQLLFRHHDKGWRRMPDD